MNKQVDKLLTHDTEQRKIDRDEIYENPDEFDQGPRSELPAIDESEENVDPASRSPSHLQGDLENIVEDEDGEGSSNQQTPKGLNSNEASLRMGALAVSKMDSMGDLEGHMEGTIE